VGNSLARLGSAPRGRGWRGARLGLTGSSVHPGFMALFGRRGFLAPNGAPDRSLVALAPGPDQIAPPSIPSSHPSAVAREAGGRIVPGKGDFRSTAGVPATPSVSPRSGAQREAIEGPVFTHRRPGADAARLRSAAAVAAITGRSQDRGLLANTAQQKQPGPDRRIRTNKTNIAPRQGDAGSVQSRN